jgi:hypothetical protein
MRETTRPETCHTGAPSPLPLDEWERGWQSFVNSGSPITGEGRNHVGQHSTRDR